jgi:hypothetical protein
MTYVPLPFHDCKFKHFSLKRNGFMKKKRECQINTSSFFIWPDFTKALHIFLVARRETGAPSGNGVLRLAKLF